jgi:hypothetical protein
LVIVSYGGKHLMERCRSFKRSPSSPGTRFFKADIGCGIDCEPLGDPKLTHIVIQKSLIEQDLDIKFQGNRHTCLTEDCVTSEPPFNLIGDPQVQFTIRRTSIHYYRIGGPNGRGNFPPDRVIDANVLFDDCDFYAGAMSGNYIYNGRTFVDNGGNDLFMTVKYDSRDSVNLHFKNCRFHKLSNTSGATYIIKSDSTDTSARVIFEGMIEIDAGMAEFPWQLRGQTVERRSGPTFKHADFPGQTVVWQGEGTVKDT